MNRTAHVPAPLLLTAVAVLAFAGNSLLTRAALAAGELGPAGFSAIRLVSGAAVLWLLVAARGASGRPDRGAWRGIVCLAVYVVAFTYAYVALGAASGALILFAAVQLTMAGVATIGGEPPRGREAAGLLLALAGLAWLLAPGLTRPPLGPALLMVTAGAAWGGYTLLGRGARQPLVATARNFVGCAPVAILLLLPASTEAWSAAGVVLAVASGALTSGLGYAIWYAALPRLGVATAGVAQLLVPPVAAAGAALWLGEALTTRLLVATAVILLGIGLTIRRR